MSIGIQDEVRARYAAAARAVGQSETASCGCGGGATSTDRPGTGTDGTSTDAATGAEDAAVACCGGGAAAGTGAVAAPAPEAAGCSGGFGAALYPSEELATLPAAARQASLGCGNPLAVADLHPGEVVLDLGSGGGGDLLLSARRVGPTGTVYGLDMTDEMLELAQRNIDEAGATNVELRKGAIEEIPLPDTSVDVIISNCVINLSADKAAVFAQMFRVLRPGGRVGVADVVADDALSPAERAERGDWVGCVAGALSRSEYVAGLAAAGFTDVDVTFTHEVADRMHSAIVKATRP